MLRWTIIFLIIAIVAAILGFGGIAAGAASLAKVLFFIFLVLFIVSLFFGRSGKRIVSEKAAKETSIIQRVFIYRICSEIN